MQSSESVHWEMLGATYILTFEMRLVVLQNGFLSVNVEWCAIEMERLLHKPYVNEATLTEHDLY